MNAESESLGKRERVSSSAATDVDRVGFLPQPNAFHKIVEDFGSSRLQTCIERCAQVPLDSRVRVIRVFKPGFIHHIPTLCIQVSSLLDEQVIRANSIPAASAPQALARVFSSRVEERLKLDFGDYFAFRSKPIIFQSLPDFAKSNDTVPSPPCIVTVPSM